MNERQAIDRGWFYVVEPDGSSPPGAIRAGDGRILTRRSHGYPGRIEVIDESGSDLPVATRLRAAAAAGFALEALGTDGWLRVRLGPAGTETRFDGDLWLDGPAVAAAPTRHPVDAAVREVLTGPGTPREAGTLPDRPVPRVLFFESLMNTDMPHNDTELSQGVLHMASSLEGTGSEVVLADVKMAITGSERPVLGLERLEEALAGGPVGLVCITLLEGYWEGVVALIATLRELGCRARIAVGGVMPSLTPEHVAAHLPGVSFVCRGAGEHFVPRLARILGDSDVDRPLTDGQIAALLATDGLLVVEPGLLLAGRCDRTVQVDDLDRVPLVLSHLTPRHVQGGIELSTSRGCVHRCTFCSILGRESYQARSADGIVELLGRYDRYFHERFDGRPPPNAYRVHISDDDFACDRDRAKRFFQRILETPFRLSSLQVSVADLCRREGGVLLPEPDTDLLDAIRPECFADHGLPLPERDYVADFRSRRWSSFLQIGVETFSDRELVRLGKGYKMAHVRAVVAELARRALHMDAYFIQSNSETTASDLVDVLEEITRLKLRWPKHFHLRFPVVPRLVSYFPSASHRRHVRHGRAHVHTLRGSASVPSHPELDYPFVEQDEPQDPWVRSAVDEGFFTDEDRYAGSLERLRERWKERVRALPPGPEREEGERLVRRLDDRKRRLAFELLRQAREAGRGVTDPDWPGAPPTERDAQATALEVLGPAEGWLRALKRSLSEEVPRVVLIPTWQCELRCRYCFIPKQDGRVMTQETAARSVDLLLSSDRDELILQFFGGEALMEWALVQATVERADAEARRRRKALRFILSSNGWSLDAEKLAWLARYPVKLELSLDGAPDLQNHFRRAADRGRDSYQEGIAPRAAAIVGSGLDHEVIMVVHPEAVDRMPDSFFHIAGLGFERIQINFGLGFLWTDAQKQAFASGLFRIGQELRRRWARGERTRLVNAEGRPMPMRLNGEVTVDWDGTVYGGNAFLHETRHKEGFVLGHLDDLSCFDRYWMDAPTNEHLLRYSYEPEITANNLAVGAILTSFVRWLQQEPVGPVEARSSA